VSLRRDPDDEDAVSWLINIREEEEWALKPQNNGPLYSNTLIGILTVDGWAVTFGIARPVPSSMYQMLLTTHQRPVYQLHIPSITFISGNFIGNIIGCGTMLFCGTIIAFAL